MGREIRMVTPNWKHPKKEEYSLHEKKSVTLYIPMYDKSYREACEQWYKDLDKFEPNEYYNWFHEEYGNPPDKRYYRPDWDKKEQTWVQVYETVSEGTPVTPPFATKQELVEYLVENGDFWDQQSCRDGWSRESAESFVDSGWRPTGMVQGGRVKMARDM